MWFLYTSILELSKWTVRSGLAQPDPLRVGHLMGQSNTAHLLMSQKNLNPAWSTTG